jgi:phage terminase large subunit GpA-like protein
MDAVSDPEIGTVVFKKSAQTGGTEVILNAIGYHIHQDPAPILVVQPNIKMVNSWSKSRLTPMLRDTPVLRGKVGDPRSKDSSNTIHEKVFEGGILAVATAGSPADLASRPIRIVLFDEVDKYPPSVKEEGDAIELGTVRTETFWNSKTVKVSTPTVDEISRIDAEWNESDQRYYEVPCPRKGCGRYQRLIFRGGVKWDKDARGNPVNVHYECGFCKGKILEHEKHRMLKKGRWVASRPWVTGIAGFHISALYSPWTSWEKIARKFLKAHRSKSNEQLRVFVNTVLGETWKEDTTTVDEGGLLARREEYGPLVPERVCAITAGVDVQDDRIEASVYGWAPGEESWLLEHAVIPGRTETDLAPWQDLDLLLGKRYPHALGPTLIVMAAAIDSGGHATMQVYDFCKPREARRIWAVKGGSKPGIPAVGRPSRNNAGNVPLRIIGTDAIKRTLFSRLKLEAPGPGFMHFPMTVDEEYFLQITAESLIKIRDKGEVKFLWKKNRERNESLDAAVYANAALMALNPNLEQYAAMIAAQAREIEKNIPVPTGMRPRVRRVLSKGIGG